ncbi:hypothetical protein [Pseudalkalibacillus salsuginis]|uniref:hypothetical protein n=1 Tax=Pseudalkalibacillus salsuginis TaxID=2910972 RepID=UPI001F30F326|nr:hypothetical protein [Pseudalkalibacillus salsuginis]MCF6411439.1 hypothetical protein [Pseudalkalibacillus salsuginis]
MNIIFIPLMMAIVGFAVGYFQEGLQVGVIYAIGFFSGSFIYRTLRHYIVKNTKKISPRR